MMRNDNDYARDIEKECLFWGRFECEANKYGIPWWCDLRRATRLTKNVCGWMSDPVIENIVRGASKKTLISTALAQKGRVLDLGCGAGWLSLELARQGADVDAVEVSSQRIDIARYYLQNNPFTESFGSIQYLVSDLNMITLSAARYQTVVCWDTLHHIPELERLIKEVRDSLVPGGRFIVYDHIGLRRNNLRLLRVMRIPLHGISMVWRFLKGKRSDEAMTLSDRGIENGEASPFEDVTGEEMIGIIGKYFKVDAMTTQLSFLADLANDLFFLPRCVLYPVIWFLKRIDDALILLRIVRGEYVFISARTKEGSL